MMIDYFLSPYTDPPKRGPKFKFAGDAAKPRATIRSEYKKRKREESLSRIAILDFETDPFDNTRPDDIVQPFLCVLYSDDFPTIIIWDENNERFISRVIAAITALPVKYTIYAHNGGKFDYQFLLHRLRGLVKFKGRGLMVAHIGKCELRDSFHILPEGLANWQKDIFDYTKLKRGTRSQYRQEIIDYCTNDCAYLLDFVKTFVKNFGLKISIGKAALAELRKHYKVARISEYQDGGEDGKHGLRQFFFGGRVECLAGRGNFRGDYKLYDVNSMYPAVMANCRHPVGNEYAPRRGNPSDFTAFIKLTCRNYGAFVKRGENGETSAEFKDGTYFVTKFEYDTALRYNLIEDVDIIECIDCNEFSDLSKFVFPIYMRKQALKQQLDELSLMGKKDTREYREVKKEYMICKYLLNTGYGKFTQNPRNFKEKFITDLGERPPEISGEICWPELPSAENAEFALWERESRPWRFLNVGTGASITGAARAVLMEGIENAIDPIYCDTDSIICRDLRNSHIDPVDFGAWEIEAQFSECIIAGKKLYACRSAPLPNGELSAKDKIRSKGVAGLDWDKMQRILDNEIIEAINKGPTMSATHAPYYMRR